MGPENMPKERLTPEFRRLLESFDQETAGEVMSVLQKNVARRPSLTGSSKPLLSKVAKKKKTAISKAHATTAGPKRPINRWMAFRRGYTLLKHTDRC
jgi:hypothetical protein